MIIAIYYLRQAIAQEPNRQTFPILENSKEFLLEISVQIMENKLSENDIKLIQDKETDKLIVRNKEIQLKRIDIDEIRITKNDNNTTKYSYYVEPEKSKFIVNIDLPGGGFLKEPIVGPVNRYFSFRFEGQVNGELSPKYEDSEKEEIKYEELSKEKLDKIVFAKNLRKKHPIHIEFKVSSKAFQLKFNSLNAKPEFSVKNTKKGIIIYMFDVILVKPGINNEEFPVF